MSKALTEKKEDRRVKKTKKVLRDSLFTLLETKSINQITVTELTKLADVNRSTFYIYYTDVYDMMEKIKQEIYTVFYETVVDSVADFTSPEGAVSYISRFLEYCRDNVNVCRFIMRNDCNNQLAELIITAIRSIVPDSENVFDKKYDPRYYLTTFALNGMLSVVLEWMNDGMEVSPTDIAKFLSYTYVLGAKMQKEGELHKVYTHPKNNER